MTDQDRSVDEQLLEEAREQTKMLHSINGALMLLTALVILGVLFGIGFWLNQS